MSWNYWLRVAIEAGPLLALALVFAVGHFSCRPCQHEHALADWAILAHATLAGWLLGASMTSNWVEQEAEEE